MADGIDRVVGWVRRTTRANPQARLLLGVVLCLGSATLVRAQDVSSLQAALALEEAMTKTIAACERSVVSIARISDDQRSSDTVRIGPPLGGVIDPGGVRIVRESSDPRDPQFVPKEFATGVVIDRSGLILTNYHVVHKDDLHLITTTTRKLFRARILAADARSDLAVLKVDGANKPVQGDTEAPEDFVPIKFGDAKSLKKGQIVIALGNPYGIARDGQASASWGIISNLARKLGPKPPGEEPTIHQFGTLIQTDARLNLGTSGGALLNLQGEMIGLTTSLAATSGFEQAAGFAIPIDADFIRIINTLKQGREVEYGFLGVGPRANDPFAPRQGLAIQRVSPGTPAHRAGLRGGVPDGFEDVITHIRGEPVSDFDDLRLQINRLPAGATTTITYQRGRDVRVVDVQLAKYRPSTGVKVRESIVTQREPAWRGLRVDFSTAVVGLREDSILRAPVAVSEVEPGSPAERAGLHPGMMIARLGNVLVETPDEFRRFVTPERGPVSIQTVDYGLVPRTFSVQPE